MSMLRWARAVGLVTALGWVTLTVAEGPVNASSARALSLDELTGDSSQVVVGTPTDTDSRWETEGSRRRIVSYTRVRVEERYRGSGGGEVLVRTLGGRVGKVGQIVHGEAVLVHGEPSLLFLAEGTTGSLRPTGFAQGHYPLRTDERGDSRVALSPELRHLHLEASERSAVRALNQRRVGEAAELIKKAGARE